MSNSRKIATDTIIRFIGQLGIGVITTISARLITGYLGVDRYGVITAATFFFSMFASISDSGTTTVAIREISKNPNKDRGILANVLGIRIVGSIILSILCIILGYIIYAPRDMRIFEALLWMVSTLIFINFSSSFKITLTTGFRAKQLVLSDIISKILSLAFLWYGIHYNWGIWVVYASPLVMLISLSIFVVLLNKKEYRVWPRFDSKEWSTIIRYTVPIAIASMLNIIYLRADGMMLSFYKSTTEVGQYGLAYKIVELLAVLPSLFGLVAMSTVANSDKAKLHNQTMLGQKYLGLIGVLSSFSVISIGRFAINILSSGQESFAPSYGPLIVLLLANIIIFYHQPISNALFAQNLQNKIMRVSLYATIFNIAINLLMIPLLGALGASISVLITEIIIYAYFRKLYSDHIHKGKAIAPIKPFIAGVLMFITSSLVRQVLSAYDLNKVIIEGLALMMALLIFMITITVSKFTTIEEIKALSKRA
jgi:O-antigen/teichoic acid export membrane protein